MKFFKLGWWNVFKKMFMVESLLFTEARVGVGAGAGEKIPEAGQKRTGSATLGLIQIRVINSKHC